MADVLEPTRKRITSFQEDYARITEQLSKPAQFVQMFNENSINQHISDVFRDANEILSTVSLGLSQESKFIPSRNPKINRYKLEIERVRTEIDRRARLFDSSIAVARQMYSDKLSALSEEYKSRLSALKETNNNAEAELEAELQAAQEDFNQKLKEELAQHIVNQKALETSLKKLKGEFDLTQKTLQTSIDASKARLVMLTKQKEMLGDTNSSMTAAIHDKFQQQIDTMTEQNTAEIEALEKEYTDLQRTQKENEAMFKEEMEKLNFESSHSDEVLKHTLEEETEKTKLIFEKKMKKVENKHKLKMDDIMHKTEIDAVQSKSTIELLRTTIEQTRKAIDTNEDRCKEQIEMINKRTDLIADEKNNEMRLVAKLHIKALEQLTQQNELNLDQEKNRARKTKQNLETKINTTIKDSETLRLRLEAEITALTRAKNKFEEEMKVKKAKVVAPPPTPPIGKHPRFSNRSLKLERYITNDIVVIDPQRLGGDEVVEKELKFRVKKFFEASKHESGFRDYAIHLEQCAAKDEIESLKLKTKSTEEEVEEMEKEKKDLEERIAEAEKRIDALQTQDDGNWREVEDHLNKVIADQQTQVMKLRDELQEAKSGLKKRDIIDLINKECDKSINEAKEEYIALKNKNEEVLERMKDEHQKEIQKIQERADTVVISCEKQIAEISEEIRQLKGVYSEKRNEDHSLWMSIRKEIADSANKVGMILNSRGSSRPVSVISRNSLRKPHLPNK